MMHVCARFFGPLKTHQGGIWETVRIERYVSVVGIKEHSGNL